MPHFLLKELPRYECLLEAAKEFPDLDPSAAEAFLHLLRTGDDAFAAAERNFTRHKITQGRFCVLMLLWRGRQLRGEMKDACPAAGLRTPAELADAANVTRATMTGLIDTLEQDGFVRREPDPKDRRMMSVSLTPQAEQFLRKFMPTHFRMYSALMAALTESERKTLVRLLSKIQSQAAKLAATEAIATN